MSKHFERLEYLHLLLRHDINDREQEIIHLEQITVGMNGTDSSSDHRNGGREESPDNEHHHHLSNGETNYDGSTHPDSSMVSSSYSRVTAGKSGRVIEKLMAENDRLRRELKVETTAREEERKAREAIRSSRDSLQSTNDNLIHQTNVDKLSLAKKDRKIEELKAEREAERLRRLEADTSLKEHTSASDKKVDELKNELAEERYERLKAGSQYTILSQGWKELDEGYRKKLEALKVELEGVREERERDHGLLQRLEVTIEQQRQEVEKLRMSKTRITDRYEKVIEAAETEIHEIRQRAESTENETDQTLVDARKALCELRHLIGVKKNLREDV